MTDPREGLFFRLLPHLSLFVSSVILGSSFVAVRAIMADQDQPAILAFLRYATATLCLAPLVLLRFGPAGIGPRLRLPHFTPRDLVMIALLGTMQFGLFHLLVNSALQFMPASRGAVIFALIPVMTMFAAALFGRDSLSALQLGAGVLAFLGVALAMGEKALADAVGMAAWRGEVLFFLAVCCGATYNALSARLLIARSVTAVTAMTMGAGAIVLFPLAIAEGLFSALPDYGPTGWWLLAYLALPGGIFGFLMFNWGLRRTSPNRAAIYVPMAPIASALLGWLLLGEGLGSLFLLGLACAVAAPILIAWRRPQGRP